MGGGSNAREPEDRDEGGALLWMRFKALEEWMDEGVGNPTSQPEVEGPREERVAGEVTRPSTSK